MNDEQKLITELYEALERITSASRRYLEERPVGFHEAFDEEYVSPLQQADKALENAKKTFS